MVVKNILLSKKQLNCTVSTLSFLENGRKQALSKLKELLEIQGCFVDAILRKHSVLMELRLTRNTTSVIVESLPKSSLMILNDNQTNLDHFTLNILSLRMLVQESISQEKGCKPFWNTQCAEVSEKLWLPTVTDCHDSVSTFLNASSSKEEGQSRFSTVMSVNQKMRNSQKTSLPSSMYSTADKWVKGDTVTKNHKVKLYPNQIQKQILHEWFGTYRYVYNRAVEYSKNPTSSADLSILFDKNHCYNFMTMRNLFVTAKGGEDTLNPWELNTPKDIRAGAIAEMTTRLSQNVSAIKRGRILRFQMKFKSKHQGGSLSIPKTSIKFKDGKVSVFNRYLTPIRLGKRHNKKKYSDEVECDSKMIYDGQNFYLLIPKKVQVKEQDDKKTSVALDPGVRTFQTGFSETEFFKAHINDTKFEKLKNKIKLLQSLWDTKKIHNPRRKHLVLRRKIKNLVDECHWKTIKHLLYNYSDVLLPSFESQDMVKGGTFLSKKTKGSMLTLSHFKFKVRLKEKAQEYKNFRIHDVNESYTTKTCSCCGMIINDVGSKKKFICSKCGSNHDRDVNAARNIFIKYSV